MQKCFICILSLIYCNSFILHKMRFCINAKNFTNICDFSGMLLLRYQRQRQDDGQSPNQQLRRNVNDHELKNESRRAATRSTLICIFVCGTLLLSLGVVILVAGLLATGEKQDNTPWLVIGPTCIVLGILVLLLSVEIIIKLRKISAASGVDESDPPPASIKRASRKNWCDDSDEEETKRVVPKTGPVAIHPSTPLKSLDTAALSGTVIHK